MHKDEHSAWDMTFPAAPGCFSASYKLNGLFHNTTEALKFWSKGMIENGFPIPEMRKLSSLQHDPEWRESFATAALLIAVAAPALRQRTA